MYGRRLDFEQGRQLGLALLALRGQDAENHFLSRVQPVPAEQLAGSVSVSAGQPDDGEIELFRAGVHASRLVVSSLRNILSMLTVGRYMTDSAVLVVGATGYLGRQVVDSLLARGKSVRALVRPGSDAGELEARGVEIVRGDMLDPSSLDVAFAGVDSVVTSAAGYTKRRKTDSDRTDTEGNRNLADAAKRAGVRRFVFLGILQSDLARDVPHFWHKVEAERYLAELGVPYVSLRPGAFFDQIMDMQPGRGRGGFALSLWSPTVPITFVLSSEVAQALAAAVDAPVRDGEHIDLGWDRPLTTSDVAELTGRALGRRVRVVRLAPVVSALLGLLGRLNPGIADFRAMFSFFGTGQYVADTRRQAELFGPVPTAEAAITRWAHVDPALTT